MTIEETLYLLETRRGEWRKVAKETGLGYEWLLKFAKGKIPEPGFGKIQTLYLYLTNTKNAA